MKKLFQIVILITLMGISFFYTEKTTSVVKEYDDIMIQIKSIYDEEKVEYENAIIDGNNIIPGISGKEININKSYNKMKRYGKFEKSLLVYNILKPKISVEKKDKFIINGNPKNMNISLIFLIKENDQIDKIINILNNKKVKGNFFFDDKWLEKESNIVVDVIKEKHNVGMLNYTDWNNSLIKKIGKQKENYCYSYKEQLSVLMKCKKNHNYTIKTNIIFNNNYYQNIKNNLKAGSIISLEANQQLENELPIIINYITSKGYEIVSLEKLLKE